MSSSSTLGLLEAIRGIQLERGSGPDVEDPDSPYQAGQLVADKYRLERCLGTGGMGSVWLGRNEVLEADVALKLIRPELASLPAVGERLLQEARAAAKLQHPAVVRVFDFGRTEHGQPFIVMEMLRGASLADVLARGGPLSSVTSIRILLPVIAGIVFAHQLGVVHRDVKPDNVLLVDVDGAILPKVVDFGIAKLRDEAQTGRITNAGAIVGSPDYMSPEQARGATDVDERADVWSACVTLYEMVTGKLPFVAPNYNALMVSILSDEPTPITELSQGDSWLWTIIGRGLEKEREARFGSMRELGRELASWAEARGISTDCTGASIRTTWLRDSERPEPERPVPTLAPRSISRPSLSGLANERPTPIVSFTHEARPPWVRRIARVGVALGGLAIVAGAIVLRGRTTRVDATASVQRAPVVVAGLATQAPAEAIPSSSAAQSAAPPAEASGPAPAPSAEASAVRKIEVARPMAKKQAPAPLIPKEPNF